MANLKSKKQRAGFGTTDLSCPIWGKLISGTTCFELCCWADEYGQGDEVYLEYLDRVKEYCKDSLGIDSKEGIVRICKHCPAHWKESRK